jgi:NAD(P)H-quinone oxidoreductase subunit 5
MSTPSLDVLALPLWHAALLMLPIAALAVAAMALVPSRSAASAWRIARWAIGVALAAALGSAAAVWGGSQGIAFGMRADTLGSVMLLLVTFVGWVIVRYAQTYLHAEAKEGQAARWLVVALAAVTTVVSSNHLLVLSLAWAVSGLALHRLLNFFGDRPAAVLAAHKKFACSRLADVCMLGVTALLALAFDTLHIDRMLAAAAAAPELPASAQAAVLLMAVAVLLKCAQLPFHGWLIQVMEAPTPVSALLHAGVVNLGGFVLLRLAPLVAEVPAAQALLVAAGAATAVLAALVMSTRISIKVMLAWSTCAQMGFMLLQCGLGAWNMALLHLVAHSVYKAHAFLGAGGAVHRMQQAQLAPQAMEPGLASRLAAATLGLMLVSAAAAGWSLLQPTAVSPVQVVLAGIVALALVPLLLQAQSPAQGATAALRSGLGAGAVAIIYLGLHGVFALGALPPATEPPPALWIAAALAFASLFALQTLVATAAQSALVRRLYPWFYGGLFLDEGFTRRLLAWWPAPQTQAVATPAWPGMNTQAQRVSFVGATPNVSQKAGS